MKANEYIQKYDHAILVVHSRKHGPTEYKIDLSDVGLASEYQWNTWVSASGARYAKSSASKARKSIKLHRLLTDFKFKIVDHADNDSTNNRRSNLRDATNSINGSNCKMYKNNSSGYRGVSFHKQNRKFTATISYNNKQIHLGSFNTDKEASDAYEAALERYHGYDVKIRDLEAELNLARHNEQVEVDAKNSLEQRISDLIKEKWELEAKLELKDTWVKHHQDSAQLSFNKASALEDKVKELEVTIKLQMERMEAKENEHIREEIELEAKLAEAEKFMSDNINRLSDRCNSQSEKLKVTINRLFSLQKDLAHAGETVFFGEVTNIIKGIQEDKKISEGV